MTYDALEESLLSKKEAWKDFPFGSSVAVCKVCAKTVSFVAWCDSPLRVTLKCDPYDADFFRTAFAAVQPGRVMHKDHWNTVTLDGSLPEGLLMEMIDSSYALVVRGLRREDREKLESDG